MGVGGASAIWGGASLGLGKIRDAGHTSLQSMMNPGRIQNTFSPRGIERNMQLFHDGEVLKAAMMARNPEVTAGSKFGFGRGGREEKLIFSMGKVHRHPGQKTVL